MTVKSTSSTAMAPMTSFARLDRVGTGTGGRMATSGLLQLQSSGTWIGLSRRPPVIPAQRTGTDRVPTVWSRTAPAVGSAGGRGAPRLVVGQRLQRIVQGGHPRQREARIGDRRRLRAVVRRDEEELGADVAGGGHLQRDTADGAD